MTPASELPGAPTPKPSVPFLAGLVVFCLTLACFAPVLGNGFVNWDDDVEILSNPMLSGLSWDNLALMFTDFSHGAYKPLAWLTLGLIHQAQGLSPLGFHIASLLIHCCNATLFFLVTRLILASRPGAGKQDPAWPAVFGALLFSLHPLRVEAVAPAHALGDLMAGGFFLASLLLHLRAVTGEDRARPRLLVLAWLAFACTGLSRWQGLSLPLVLVVLDFYPLARLRSAPRTWASPASRPVWLEKLPYAAISVCAVLLNLKAKVEVGGLAQASASLPSAQGFISTAFYLWKTVWPSGLDPYYILTGPFARPAWRPELCGLLVVSLSIGLIIVRRRWPSGLAVWLHYLAALAPTLEFFHGTAMSVHDRYSYVACMGLPLLAAGLLETGARSSAKSPVARLAVQVVAACLPLALAAASWRQTAVWRSPETLWTHVLSRRPDSFVALSRLGAATLKAEPLAARRLLEEAARINPSYAEPRLHLGRLHLDSGDTGSAKAEFQAARDLDPAMLAASQGLAMAHSNEGLKLYEAGDRSAAVTALERAFLLFPDSPKIRRNLETAQAGLRAAGVTPEGAEGPGARKRRSRPPRRLPRSRAGSMSPERRQAGTRPAEGTPR
ncbi:MAG: hypothetical protein HY924_08205 [Elusimicrobia bacterium]|nr:hypothetical protein [Elusimicrobiota bacterium]